MEQKSIFNKSFFHFTIGFLGIIVISLVIFSVTSNYLESYYPQEEAVAEILAEEDLLE